MTVEGAEGVAEVTSSTYSITVTPKVDVDQFEVARQ